MAIRVRFAPAPTGSLHLGNALGATANRRFGDHLLLRICLLYTSDAADE